MPTIQHILSVAQSSLQASQSAVAVANNNISNVNTPGWAREVLPLQAALGNMGVATSDPTALRNALLERSLGATSGRLGFFQTQVDHLSQLEAATNDLDGNGLGVALADFGAALANASANPGGSVERDQILQAARTLSGAFKTTRSQLDQGREAALADAEALASRANALAAEIAELNTRIQATAGSDANGLVARRSDLVGQLSSLVGVHSVRRSDGSVHLETAGGRPLVEAGFASRLRVQVNGDVPEIVVEKAQGQVLEMIGEIGGEIGGALEVYSDRVTPTVDKLDEMAYAFMEAFNSVHEAGFNLNGGTGLQFFDLPDAVEGAAAALNLSPDVDGFPEHIAGSADLGGVPGSNANLLALEALIDQDGVLPSGQSVEGAWNLIVDDFAYGLVRARAGVALETESLEMISNMLASETGVNIDEELIKVTQANAALEASSTVIKEVQTMTNTILGLVS
ncbi:MAG: flagellar hook-associated protein FlgK [Proteobacteria bacterium]|nr:MAG: flagellar hook-associated protein FlgK [Pseudomonadota bacterium]